jgi:hypothetical protein
MAKFLKQTAGGLIEEATVAASVGSADAGKLPHLDAAGLLDGSFLPGVGRRVLLGADVGPSTSTTAADVTGLSFAVTAGVTYQFEFYVVWRCAATTGSGIGLSINGPASPTTLAYMVDTPSSATARTLGNRRAYDTFGAVTAIDAANSDSLATIRGVLRPSASGTLIVRYRAGTSGSGATVKANSFGLLREMATDASSGGTGSRIGIDETSASTYTMVLGDIGRMRRFTHASGVTVTIPTNASVPCNQGDIWQTVQWGTGLLSFVGASGVNLRYRGVANAGGRYAPQTLIYQGSDEWLLCGDLAV